IVLGPVSLADIVPSHPEQKGAAAQPKPTPPASPAAIDPAPIDEELDYMVAKRRALLAADGAEVSADESAHIRAQRAADEGVLWLRRLAGRDDHVSPEGPKVKLLRPTDPYVWTPPAQA